MDPKPSCKYGSNCYRKNKEHLEQYRHDSKAAVNQDATTESAAKRQKKTDNSSHATQKISDYFQKDTKIAKTDRANTDIIDDTRQETHYKYNVTDNQTEPEKHQETTKKVAAKVYAKSSDDITTTAHKADTIHDAGETNCKCNCVEDDDSDTPPVDSPLDIRENIKLKYGVEMPDDFYKFWDLCEKLCPQKPKDALKPLLGYSLTGPYDIVANTRSKSLKSRPNFLLHARYYYDPPEFMTVIKGDDSDQFHIGYYRDDPAEMPAYLASNSSTLGCALSPKGDNLFAALKYFITERLKRDDHNSRVRADLTNLQGEVTARATELGYCMDLKSSAMKARDKRVVCKTMNGAGVVVPVDANDVGYRPVPETLADLKRILKRIADSPSDEERDRNFEPLQELITLVQFANDEGDYGEGLELGLQLFCYGAETFHAVIGHLLPLAYELLDRQLYADVIRAHVKHRRCRGCVDQTGE